MSELEPRFMGLWAQIITADMTRVLEKLDLLQPINIDLAGRLRVMSDSLMDEDV